MFRKEKVKTWHNFKLCHKQNRNKAPLFTFNSPRPSFGVSLPYCPPCLRLLCSPRWICQWQRETLLRYSALAFQFRANCSYLKQFAGGKHTLSHTHAHSHPHTYAPLSLSHTHTYALDGFTPGCILQQDLCTVFIELTTWRMINLLRYALLTLAAFLSPAAAATVVVAAVSTFN